MYGYVHYYLLMGKTVLVTDVDTPLGYALFRNYLNDGSKVAGTVSSLKKNIRIPDIQKESTAIIEWSRISPVESKNLLLSIIKKFKRLDEAVVIQPRQSTLQQLPDLPDHELTTEKSAQPGSQLHMNTHHHTLLHETGIVEIDKEIDYRIKGLLYISREIIKNFAAQKNGFLLFVNNFYHTDDSSALSHLIVSGISGFLKGLMRAYGSSGFSVNAVESISPVDQGQTGDEEFASFIYKSVSEKLKDSTGKYLRFAPRKNFLSGLGKMIKGRT